MSRILIAVAMRTALSLRDMAHARDPLQRQVQKDFLWCHSPTVLFAPVFHEPGPSSKLAKKAFRKLKFFSVTKAQNKEKTNWHTEPRAPFSLAFFFYGPSSSDFLGGTLGGLRSCDFRFFLSAIAWGPCLTSNMVDRAAFAEDPFSATTELSSWSSSECPSSRFGFFGALRACFLPWAVSSSFSSSVSSSSSSSPSSACASSSSYSSLSSSSPSNQVHNPRGGGGGGRPLGSGRQLPPPTNCWPEAPWGGGGSWRPRTRGVAPPPPGVTIGFLAGFYAGGHHDAPRNKAWIQRLSRFPQ